MKPRIDHDQVVYGAVSVLRLGGSLPKLIEITEASTSHRKERRA
jgi:hypothetical protein